MTMTNEEICRDYRQSKKRLAQIQILAQLNNCGRDKIVEILKEGGEELPGQYKPKQKGKRQPKLEPVETAAPAPEQPKEDAKGVEVDVNTIKNMISFIVGQSTLSVINDIANEAYDPAGKAHRIEGVLALWREITERCEDE